MAQILAGRLLREREPDAAVRPSAVPALNPYTLRAATPADVTTLEDIEREAFPTLTATTPFRREVRKENALYLIAIRPWTAEERRERRRQGHELAGLIGPFKRLASALLFERIGGGRKTSEHEYAAGVIGLWFVLDECHIVIIASRLRERRRGVGELLLIGAIEAALERGSRVITLEVRASNEAARTLYRKYGFQEVGTRKRYYSDNNEDAIIMTTPPIQGDEYRNNFESLVRGHAARWGESVRAVA